MGSGMSWSAGLARTLALWWQARRKQARSERRPEESVDRTLADAALARADVTSARAQVRSDMSRMMRYLDVDPDRIPGPFWGAVHEAEWVCTKCVSVGRCRRWSQPQPTDDAPRRFCPNAQLYEDIAISQRRAHQPNDSPND
jgi:hypothetical protein